MKLGAFTSLPYGPETYHQREQRSQYSELLTARRLNLLACWNVRSMTTGLSDDIYCRSWAMHERLRWLTTNCWGCAWTLLHLRKLDWQNHACCRKTITHSSGKERDHIKSWNVVLALLSKNAPLKMIEPRENGAEKILLLWLLPTEETNWSMYICPNPPHPTWSEGRILETATGHHPEHPQLRAAAILLGDFNARVDADQKSWSSCLGHYGIGNMNKIGH